MSENADVPAVDLDRMSVPQLTALIAAAEAKRPDKLDDARAALRAEMERRAAELGMAPGELFSAPRQQPPAEQAVAKDGRRARKPRDDTGAKRAAKYRGPKSLLHNRASEQICAIYGANKLSPDAICRESALWSVIEQQALNGEEWSGRGRTPKWLAALEAEGRKRDEFRV